MQAPNKKSLIAAAAAPFALTLALGAAPAYAEGTNSSSTTSASSTSEAVITIDGCNVTSDKDISHVAYFLDGELVGKKENVNSTTFTLNASLEFDSVVVKSGTTETGQATTCSTVTDQSEPEPTQKPEPTQAPDENESDENELGGTETPGETETLEENETPEKIETESETDVDAGVDAEVGGEDDEGSEEEKPAVTTEGGNGTTTQGGNDDVAGAEANAGADVRGNASVEVRGNATTSTPQGDADVVLGAEGGTQAYQPTTADGSTQYLPNTGAEENAALIAGGAGVAGFGAWMMLKRRRFGLER